MSFLRFNVWLSLAPYNWKCCWYFSFSFFYLRCCCWLKERHMPISLPVQDVKSGTRVLQRPYFMQLEANWLTWMAERMNTILVLRRRTSMGLWPQRCRRNTIGTSKEWVQHIDCIGFVLCIGDYAHTCEETLSHSSVLRRPSETKVPKIQKSLLRIVWLLSCYVFQYSTVQFVMTEMLLSYQHLTSFCI